jgi:glycosyltransferase involved in cell wall biosynthesis
MTGPIISIAIATYNSESTLAKTLDSIKKQTYSQSKIEILIIDGGSIDNTILIANRYKSTVISNYKTELIYAKHLGFLKAKGRYLMYLDSDEVLENPKSLEIKLSAFQKVPHVKAVMLSGYKSPTNGPEINNYINEFGDPFSFFVYRQSMGDKFLINSWINKYKKFLKNNDRNFLVFDFNKVKPLPLIELWAGGCMIDIEFCRKKFRKIKRNPGLIAHLFYLLNDEKKLISITKNDATIHYSVESLSKYLKKIGSRVKNNVFNTAMGEGGFVGREDYQTDWIKFKKFLFIPYSLSLIIPCMDGLYLYLSRKKIIYLLHPFLCIYTSTLILYYLILKILHINPRLKNYGA